MIWASADFLGLPFGLPLCPLMNFGMILILTC
jgi:hypothetical protein